MAFWEQIQIDVSVVSQDGSYCVGGKCAQPTVNVSTLDLWSGRSTPGEDSLEIHSACRWFRNGFGAWD